MEQFNRANNMTDRFAALSVLAYAGGAGREEAITRFETSYQSNALVLDKWFALQASLPDAGTLQRVQHLLSHPNFSLLNPNRTRSLIGGFAMSNPTQFNRADGAGYEFVVDLVHEIDAKNPQVSSRIMTAFRSWRGLEPIRRERARHALERLSNRTVMSRDLRDIVDRTVN